MRALFVACGLILALALGATGQWAWRNFLMPPPAQATAIPSAAPQAAPATPASQGASDSPCQVQYYRNPMGLPDVSPVPKKDNMGMDYIAVCAEADTGGGFAVSPQRQQALGVTLVAVKRQDLLRQIDATGLVQMNERAVSIISPRVEGWIEELLVNATGDLVAKGTPLARVFSPELIQAQVNFRIAVKDGPARSRGAAERLLLLGLSQQEIDRLAQGGEVAQTSVLVAPHDGTVMRKMATDGMHFDAGTPLLEIADLRRIWVIAELYERDLALVAPGMTVDIQVEAFPARSFVGRVEAVLPEVMMDTRTAQVRIELANDEGLLRPGMFARVSLRAVAARDVLVAPRSAVLDAGDRQVVLVALGDGRFEARSVALGAATDDLVEVIEGLEGGEKLVQTAAFLIDAESNIRAALQAFAPPPATATGAAETAP